MTKTEQLIMHIMEQISSLQIAGYLKEEVSASLKYLHRYKLRNIEKNLTCFCKYLLFLNQQNTDKILNLTGNTVTNSKNPTRDLSYFIAPAKPLSKKAQSDSLKKITEHSYELLTLIQGIKGILVLSIDEFCNASPTRMGIHQLLMAREQSTAATLHTKKKGICA